MRLGIGRSVDQGLAVAFERGLGLAQVPHRRRTPPGRPGVERKSTPLCSVENLAFPFVSAYATSAGPLVLRGLPVRMRQSDRI